MRDGSRYAMWFDHEGTLAFAESASPGGPWHANGSQVTNSYDTVLSGVGGQFDHFATSPSVLRVNGLYYMYYDAYDNNPSNTVIGVATSSDGVLWQRRAAPILTPKKPSSTAPPASVGAPSAFYSSGQFYLLFADTTAPLAKPNTNGDYVGQVLIRSTDPTFESGIESFTWSGGWVQGDLRTDAIVQTTGADMALVPELGRVIVVYTERVKLLDLTARTTSEVVHPPLRSYDRGLFRDPHGTLRLADDCATLPLDVSRTVTEDAGVASDLAHLGFDIRIR